MRVRNIRNRWVYGVLVGIVMVVTAWIVAMPSMASARVVTCRKDPVVYLSNGKTIKVTETIYAAATDVTHVTYTVHVPAGVTVTKMVFTGGASDSTVEQIYVFADLQPTKYSTTTRVTTLYNGVVINAQTTIGKSVGTANGYNGQDLTVNLAVK